MPRLCSGKGIRFKQIARLQPSHRRNRRRSDVKITDANFANDLAVLSEHLKDATILLHHLEKATSEAGLNTNSKKQNF